MVSSQLWLRIDAAVGFIVGIFLYLRPEAATPFILSGRAEGVHWHLIRCCGAQLVAEAFSWWKLSSSTTPESRTTCFFVRLITCVLLLMSILHARAFYSQHFHDLFLIICMVMCGIGIAGSLDQLIGTGAPMGQRRELKLEPHLSFLPHLDAIAALIIGVAWMSFPDWLLRRQVEVELNGTHIFFGRCMGAYFLASHVITAQSNYWSETGDWKSWLYGRTLMCGGIFFAQIWSQIAYHAWWTQGHWVGIGLYSIWTTICFWLANQTATGKLLKNQ